MEFSSEIQAKSLQVSRERVIPGWLIYIGWNPGPSNTRATRAARAVDIFNRRVGPVVGLRIEVDGTVTELRQTSLSPLKISSGRYGVLRI